MKESSEGYAILQEFDSPTFKRFVHWAYKGFYYPANHCTVLESVDDDDISPASKENVEETYYVEEAFEVKEMRPDRRKRYEPPRSIFGHVPEPIEDSRESRLTLRQAFRDRQYHARRDNIQTPQPRANESEDEDYTEVRIFALIVPLPSQTDVLHKPKTLTISQVFLSHARLYVLAQYFQIDQLRILALEELHAVLAKFTLFPGRAGDIIELMSYVYENTSESVDDTKNLRSLMAGYMGYEMDVLMTDKRFGAIMIADGGELQADFFWQVRKRIAE